MREELIELVAVLFEWAQRHGFNDLADRLDVIRLNLCMDYTREAE